VGALGSISCVNIWRAVYWGSHLSQFAECNEPGNMFTLTPDVVKIHRDITEINVEIQSPVVLTTPVFESSTGEMDSIPEGASKIFLV